MHEIATNHADAGFDKVSDAFMHLPLILRAFALAALIGGIAAASTIASRKA